jgi:RNA polymerase-binding transcription factor DksA
MKTFICDRCGKVIDENRLRQFYNSGKMHMIYPVRQNTEPVDLCADCREEFEKLWQKFMEAGKCQ